MHPLKRRRTSRKVLLLAGFSSVALISGASFLATTGSISPAINVLPGSSSTGQVATVTGMSSSVTRSQGRATLQVGIALAQVTESYLALNKSRIDVTWVNATDAGRIFNNPNAQISVGVYHVVHTGDCSYAPSNDVEAPLVNITVSSQTYCAALDTGSTGSGVSSGKLLLTKTAFSGYLSPSEAGSGSLSACAAISGVTNESQEEAMPWCQLASTTDANQNDEFIVASITTPGGNPQGQQPDLNTLQFFIQAKTTGV